MLAYDMITKFTGVGVGEGLGDGVGLTELDGRGVGDAGVGVGVLLFGVELLLQPPVAMTDSMRTSAQHAMRVRTTGNR